MRSCKKLLPYQTTSWPRATSARAIGAIGATWPGTGMVANRYFATMIFLPDARLVGIDAEPAVPNPNTASLPASRVVGQTKSCSILVHLQLIVLWTVVFEVLVDTDATPINS